LVLAGLMAAILGSMAAGLSAVSSMITYDFVLKAVPRLSERGRVAVGRGLIVAVLIVCSAAAPLIGEYSGLFAYLVKLWSLLAPPVFVCVVFGIFSRRADNRGAIATLAVGAVLGAVAFVMLDSPTTVARLPVYLRNTLNLGFVITLICTAVMLLCSRRTISATPRYQLPTTSRDATMSPQERRRYHGFLGLVLLCWIVVVVIFSPWGLAGR